VSENWERDVGFEEDSWRFKELGERFSADLFVMRRSANCF